MSLQIKDISSKQSDKSRLISTYEHRLKKMSNNNRISTEFEIARKETEEFLKNRFDKLKAEASISIDMKVYDLNSNKYLSSYNQPSADLIKCTLLKSPERYSHASQFTKYLSFMTLEGDNHIRIKNGRMPFFLTSVNIYHQTRSGHHKNHS